MKRFLQVRGQCHCDSGAGRLSRPALGVLCMSAPQCGSCVSGAIVLSKTAAFREQQFAGGGLRTDRAGIPAMPNGRRLSTI